MLKDEIKKRIKYFQCFNKDWYDVQKHLQKGDKDWQLASHGHCCSQTGADERLAQPGTQTLQSCSANVPNWPPSSACVRTGKLWKHHDKISALRSNQPCFNVFLRAAWKWQPFQKERGERSDRQRPSHSAAFTQSQTIIIKITCCHI